MRLIIFLNSFLISPIMFALLFLCGVILFIRLRGRPLITPLKVIKGLFGNGRREMLSSFRAMTVALAGTLGVGNIVGVATAIHAGGAGAVFWMLVSAFFAMIIKYAEIVLAIKFRQRDKGRYYGGAAYYISLGLGKRGVALLFSFLCIIASFTVGNMIQVNAAANALESQGGIRPVFAGALIGVFSFFVIYKGVGRIADFTLRLIPALSGLFILFSCVIIFANYRALPAVFSRIINEAFTPSSAFGGILGFLLMKSLRYGVVRGIGSNEAGCGTAPTAHATAETDSPEKQGYWGIFEVFADTVVICTLCALVILIYPENISEYDGIVLAIKAFEGFYGELAGGILCLAVFFFAFSTVISWSYYAVESIAFITRKKIYQKIYMVIYCLACIAGAQMSLDTVWELSDMTISLMTIINCGCVIALSKKHLHFVKK